MTSEAAKIRVIAHEAWKSNPVLRSAALCANGEATGVIETGYGDELKGVREAVAAIEKDMKVLDEQSQAITSAAEAKFKTDSADLMKAVEAVEQKYAPHFQPIQVAMWELYAKRREILAPFRAERNVIAQQLRADAQEKTKDISAALVELRTQLRERAITQQAYLEAARPLLAQMDELQQPLQAAASVKFNEIDKRSREALMASGVQQEIDKLLQDREAIEARAQAERAPFNDKIAAIEDEAVKALEEKLAPHMEQREKTVKALVAAERKVDDMITQGEDRAAAALEQVCQAKVAAKPGVELAPEVRSATLYSALESEGSRKSYGGELLCKAEGSEAIPVSTDTNNLLERLGELVPMAVKECAAFAKQR